MCGNELDLADDGWCFGCGKENPAGLKLDFEVADRECVTEFIPGKEHQGWVGITHGGILSTIADETMAQLVWVKGFRTVTAEFSIKFKRPARTGVLLRAVATIEEESGRTIHCKAVLEESGAVVAEASARMVKV